MFKLKELINKTYETGRLPKGLTVCLFRQLEDIYDELMSNKQSEFASSEIKNVLEWCKINVKEKSIGYVACL